MNRNTMEQNIKKSQTRNSESLNPRGSVSLTPPRWRRAPVRRQSGSNLLFTSSRQRALATTLRAIRGKLKMLTFGIF